MRVHGTNGNLITWHRSVCRQIGNSEDIKPFHHQTSTQSHSFLQNSDEYQWKKYEQAAQQYASIPNNYKKNLTYLY